MGFPAYHPASRAGKPLRVSHVTVWKRTEIFESGKQVEKVYKHHKASSNNGIVGFRKFIKIGFVRFA